MEPLRPSDHYDSDPTGDRQQALTGENGADSAANSAADSAAGSAPNGGTNSAGAPQGPTLGPGGWLRFIWRQLTSMKTALFLLLLLALGAIPGSLVPQRVADPNGVIQFKREDPELFEVLDALQLFDTYTSVWFSAIYILLFISLVGCIIPRTTHHINALRAAPPKTPKNLSRLEGYRRVDLGSGVDPDATVAHATQVLKKAGYRTAVYDRSVAGEKGYLRETANLVFHFALVGVLLGLALGTGFKYSGQRVIVEGTSFTNQLASYDSFTSGAFVDDADLVPYGLRLDSFEAEYEFDTNAGVAQPLDFVATVDVLREGVSEQRTIKVNQPLDFEGTSVYLLGNGFAPWVSIENPDGDVVYSEPVVFLPQDSNLTSLGVVKIPDGLSEQVGLLGFFYPSAVVLDSGALSSVFPTPDQPVMTLNVFTGDLGLDEGIPRNVYSLETEEMTQVAGGTTDNAAVVLGLGQSAELPNGLGTITFESLPRFVSVDVHRDPTQLPVGISSLFIVAGLVTSLFVVRRRAWIKVVAEGDGQLAIEVAGLSRGDDPGLDAAMDALAEEFSQGTEITLKS